MKDLLCDLNTTCLDISEEKIANLINLVMSEFVKTLRSDEKFNKFYFVE